MEKSARRTQADLLGSLSGDNQFLFGQGEGPVVDQQRQGIALRQAEAGSARLRPAKPYTILIHAMAMLVVCSPSRVLRL